MRQLLRSVIQAGPSSIQADQWEYAIAPFPWEVLLNWSGAHHQALPTDSLVYYHPGRVDPLTDEEVEAGWYAVAGPAVHAIKVYADRRSNRVENGAFRFSIHRSLNATKITHVAAFNGTAGSGPTTVQISNQTRGFDILEVPITIDSGEYDSETAGTQPQIDTGGDPANPRNKVYTSDRIWIDTDAVAAGSKGLGVYIQFA
jgi:hypothetical protein